MATSKKPTTHQVYNPNTKILNINNGQKIKNVATGQVFGTKNGLTPQQQAGRASLRASTPVPQQVKSPTTHQVYKNGSLISTPLINPNAPKTPPKAGPYYEAPVPIGARDKVNTSGKNWFTNQSTGIKHNTLTGQYVNQAGEYVNADGSPIEPTQEPVASYADIGKANIQSEYDANLGAELDLTGQASGYKSMEEYFKDQYAALKENTAMQKEQYNAQKEQIGQQTGQQVNAIQGQVGSMAPSREGAATSSYDRLQEVAGTQIQRLQQAQDLSMKSIEQLKTNLDRAERAGDTELAQQYRSQLLSAESQAQQTETDLVNALTSQASTEATLKQSSIQTFQGLIDNGQDLSVETISSFANELGVPFEAAYGYYAGAQAIRDDKTLSLEEKQVALDQAKQDLEDQITGMDTQAAKNMKAYISMVQNGATEDQIAAFKEMAGITDYNDPFTQAELKAKNLQNQISQYEADNLGKPPPAGSPERLDYDIKKAELNKANYELNQLYKNSGGFIDSTTAEQIFQIPGTSKWHSGANEWECGEAYNRITNEGGAGDDYSTKMDLVTKRDNPMIGNGLVLPLTAKGQGLTTGHIETVINVSPTQFQTVSWNRNGDGQQTVQTYDIAALNDQYGDNWGFTDSTLKPEYQQKLAEGTNAQYGTDEFLAGALAGSKGGAKVDVTSEAGLMKSMQAVNQIDMLMTSLDLGKAITTDADGNKLAESIDTSPLTGWLRSNNPWDASAQETKAILQGTIPIVARGVFGEVGVLTDQDIKQYQQVLPNLTQTDQVKSLVTAALLKTVKQGMYDRLNLLANTGYDVSGLYPTYQALSQKVAGLESSLGIGSQEEDLGALYDQSSDYSFSQNNLWDSLPNK